MGKGKSSWKLAAAGRTKDAAAGQKLAADSQKTKPPRSVAAITRHNRELTSQLKALAKTQTNESPIRSRGVASDSSDLNTGLKPILGALFENIGQIDSCASIDVSTPSLIAAWLSFLPSIAGVANIGPSGSFVAARMTLYLMRAVLEDRWANRRFDTRSESDKLGGGNTSMPGTDAIRDRAAFLLQLDDLLLEQLKAVWSQGRGLDDFKWVFFRYEVLKEKGQDPARHQELRAQATALHLQELEAIDGAGDLPVCPPYELKPLQDDPHGPILGWYQYWVPSARSWQSKGTEWESAHRQVLRRSLQFVLDAQKQQPVKIHEQRLHLARIVLELQHNLPAELRDLVYDEIGEAEPEGSSRYAQKLDLAEVYEPFPDHMKDRSLRCDACASRGKPRTVEDMMLARTCPHSSVVIWNLPMRCLMTFHPDKGGDLEPCKHTNCKGHHEDSSWRMSEKHRERDLRQFLSRIIAERCGPNETLESVGFGSTLSGSPEEAATAPKKSYHPCERRKGTGEWGWIGQAGLMDAMVHKGSLFELAGPSYPNNISHHRTASTWRYGYMKRDEDSVRDVFPDCHSLCQFCRAEPFWGYYNRDALHWL
ncbi:hypothetical protein GQ53DRAFT_127971 [Thozetella sp. PMI_491]|nr:hypothetical protein GQ53DRAFT_127971 [Thozetella sp. PMI_491]